MTTSIEFFRQSLDRLYDRFADGDSAVKDLNALYQALDELTEARAEALRPRRQAATDKPERKIADLG